LFTINIGDTVTIRGRAPDETFVVKRIIRATFGLQMRYKVGRSIKPKEILKKEYYEDDLVLQIKHELKGCEYK